MGRIVERVRANSGSARANQRKLGSVSSLTDGFEEAEGSNPFGSAKAIDCLSRLASLVGRADPVKYLFANERPRRENTLIGGEHPRAIGV